MFDVFAQQIDRDSQKYADLCETNKKNRGSRPSTTVHDRQRPYTTVNDRTQEKEKEEEKDKDKEEFINDDGDTRARTGEYTDEEIRKHREDLSSVEDMARVYGLPVNIGNLQTAEGLIGAYGVDRVIEAIKIAGDGKEQTWRYVKGILEKAKAEGGFKTIAEKKARVVNGQNYQQRDYSQKPQTPLPDWMIQGMKDLENVEV